MTVVHDTKRCPGCDTLGKIVDRTTRPDMSVANGRTKVRDRTCECYECETRWDYYV